MTSARIQVRLNKKTFATGARLYEEIGGLYFAVFGGLSAEGTPKTKQNKDFQ